MVEEHLKKWLRNATKEKYTEREDWEKLVSIKKSAFWDGHILELLECTMMVLIPKGGGGYRGIGLIEVIWKV